MQGKLLILGLAALAIFGCNIEVATQPAQNSSSQGVQSIQPPKTASRAGTVVKSGSFVKANTTPVVSLKSINISGNTGL